MPSVQPNFLPRVLLVEDSEDDAFFFRWTLKRSGVPCDVVHVVDGAEAIRHFEAGLAGTAGARLPDLVFLDLKIPVFSGFEVLAWLRNRKIDPPLDVAVLSGSEHAGDIERARALGASAYFVKPISVEQLRERLTAWCDKNGANPDKCAAEAVSCAAPGRIE